MHEPNFDFEPDPGYVEEPFTELVARLRRRPPRRGLPHKTFDELADEQGVGPTDVDRLMALRPPPFYEGFEEDITRMRRGLPPLGRRK